MPGMKGIYRINPALLGTVCGWSISVLVYSIVNFI